MVDQRGANEAEKHIMRLLSLEKKLSKYKLVLHHGGPYGVDIEATAPGYEDFAIEIENTEGKKWGPRDPAPTSWKKGYSVPSRKKKFFQTHPFCIYIKVNDTLTRAMVIPMSFIFCEEEQTYDNSTSSHFSNNTFHVIPKSDHPAVGLCKIEDVPNLVSDYFQALTLLKRSVSKYTDQRPVFHNKEKSNA